MLVNNNLNICGRLVRRDFRFHRVKNLILILACALVTGLYSFVFLLAGSIEGAYLLNTAIRGDVMLVFTSFSWCCPYKEIGTEDKER